MIRRVLVAPAKFEDLVDSPAAAQALAEGWRRSRPDDDLVLLPMVDGSAGTGGVLAGLLPDASWIPVAAVDAIGRPKMGRYLRAGDIAVVELAEICGIDGVDPLNPMGAHTIGLGILLAAALRDGVAEVFVALAGSASTDGGAGALSALGARFVGRGGVLPVGGEGLPNLARVDCRWMSQQPDRGVHVLVDIDSPLFGPNGAAYADGPHKGASPEQVSELEKGLRRLADVLGGEPEAAGAGAAGGAGYGLACWGGRLVPGADAIADLIGLPTAVASADVVLTGLGVLAERPTGQAGQADEYVIARAGSRPTFVVARSVAESRRGPNVISLEDVAGSDAFVRAEPERWLADAASRLALLVDEDA
jgi:glycerate kinase